MKIEMKKHRYQFTYGALDWLCIAERLENFGHTTKWPEWEDDGRQAVATWARGVYDSAISESETFTLTLPRSWAFHLLRVLAEAADDDEFPWFLFPQYIGQIKLQNKRKTKLP